uniref:Uncharacterized protein n=1 Tax=Sphaerodactylus townsendi TaxID=933632 RepID=A0ACB8FV20_9SAUR
MKEKEAAGGERGKPGQAGHLHWGQEGAHGGQDQQEVLAYVLSVSLAVIVLTVYYSLIWQPMHGGVQQHAHPHPVPVLKELYFCEAGAKCFQWRTLSRQNKRTKTVQLSSTHAALPPESRSQVFQMNIYSYSENVQLQLEQ